MNLTEVKHLLDANGIPYHCEEFENEREYWTHRMTFPYLKNAKPCKVLALVIRSNNGEKNIGIQFNQEGEDFIFQDVYFGDYSFELFDFGEEFLAEAITDRISEVMGGKLSFVIVNNLKKRCWIGDACFDLDDENDRLFGKLEYDEVLRKINKPKSFLAKLLHSKMQYEIYDWNHYQRIVK